MGEDELKGGVVLSMVQFTKDGVRDGVLRVEIEDGEGGQVDLWMNSSDVRRLANELLEAAGDLDDYLRGEQELN